MFQNRIQNPERLEGGVLASLPPHESRELRGSTGVQPGEMECKQNNRDVVVVVSSEYLDMRYCVVQEAAKAGSYQVFGGGPRMCAGNMYARLQLAVLLHHLALGFR